MRALVTGATGFVGSYVVSCLVGRGHEVAVLRRRGGDTRRIRPFLSQLTTIEGDLALEVGVGADVAAFAPEVVFHLAWSGVDRSRRADPDQLRLNLGASLDLLGRAAEAGCRTWIGLGSQAEYGPQNRKLDEAAELAPRDAYGRAKVEVADATRRAAGWLGVRFLWVRLFSAYGPADHPSALIPHVIESLMRGDRPALTEGRQLWDYLYADDAAEALVALAESPAAEGVFNLGSGEVNRVRDVVERVRDLIDPARPLGFGEIPAGAGAITHLQADIGRLTRVTGWRPRVGLDEGLARTVDWHRRIEGRGTCAA